MTLTSGCAAGDNTTDSSAYESSSAPYDPSTEDPYTEDEPTEDEYTDEPYTEDPYTEDPYTDDPYDTETEAPDPYESGTCLNGTLPTSTTAQEVSDADEVSCSASDAHYQVIETIPFTSDMSRCNSNPRTEYAFSSRYTINGATINEYVYCLIGLGSYAQY
ncbi:hypothetical protein [Streptomyces sp. NPDC127197]|uniref:LppU/SCO3897 family protein n=1 Tax=Streptomyces sp. NPDC127197 TaxID=3345388 RepID=UPI0036359277